MNPPDGLNMRKRFDEQLRQEITRARAGGSPLALLVIEIDRFGILEDSHGPTFHE